MAQEGEGGAPPSSGDGLAAALAMSTAGPLDPRAVAWLEEQTRLARLQAKDLEREDRVRHWSLRVRHISDVLKLGFELAIAFIVLAIAIGLGVEIWAATRADGLVIEAFSVPPAMAGNKAGAQKQFGAASHLCLTAREKSELARVSHG